MADCGIFALGDTAWGVVSTDNSGGQPADADSTPSLRVYSLSGPLAAVPTVAYLQSGSVTGATNASPIVITSSAHGLQTGMKVTISGVVGNTAANSSYIVTKIDANTFSLDGSTGNGAYVSGGSWHVSGLYKWSIEASAANGFASGEKYTVSGNSTISSQHYEDADTFIVV